jgi:hypothetical protein
MKQFWRTGKKSVRDDKKNDDVLIPLDVKVAPTITQSHTLRHLRSVKG